MLFSKTIVDPAGNVLANTSVTVFELVGNLQASIFSDAAMLVAKANPTMTDANGLLEFYAQPNFYYLVINKIGISNQDPIRFFDPSEIVTVIQTLVTQATTAAADAAASAAAAAASAALAALVVEDVIAISWNGNVTITPEGSKIYAGTVSGPTNLTIDMSLWPVGKGGGLVIRANGMSQITWPGNVRWPGGSVPTLTDAALVSLVTTDGASFDATLGGVDF